MISKSSILLKISNLIPRAISLRDQVKFRTTSDLTSRNWSKKKWKSALKQSSSNMSIHWSMNSNNQLIPRQRILLSSRSRWGNSSLLLNQRGLFPLQAPRRHWKMKCPTKLSMIVSRILTTLDQKSILLSLLTRSHLCIRPPVPHFLIKLNPLLAIENIRLSAEIRLEVVQDTTQK